MLLFKSSLELFQLLKRGGQEWWVGQLTAWGCPLSQDPGGVRGDSHLITCGQALQWRAKHFQ